jgi:hypothetical protein
LRVIRARLIGDAEIGTEKSGAEFGDQLLDRVGVTAETLPSSRSQRLGWLVQCVSS